MKIFSNFRPITSPIYEELRILFKDKPVTFFYDYIPKSIDELQLNPYNFILLHEPDEIFGMHSWVQKNYHLFTGILTWSEKLLSTLPNAILFHHIGEGGSGTIENNYLEDFNNTYTAKHFEISFLSGAKSITVGHQFRQEIYKMSEWITVPKKWYFTLNDFNNENFKNGGVGRPDNIWPAKKICFTESMFHIGVENVYQSNWYTEKITDAFATKTLPIYWGCPNLGELGYDERGIIRFNTIPELIKIVNDLTPDVYYQKQKYMEYNCQMIKHHRFKDKLIAFFKELCELNNI